MSVSEYGNVTMEFICNHTNMSHSLGKGEGDKTKWMLTSPPGAERRGCLARGAVELLGARRGLLGRSCHAR